MKSVLIIYKSPGETPLMAVEKFRAENPEYQDQKLGYAGRLDPMAEGILLVLVGDENKKRKDYEKLPKEYEFSFIPGISTDSYDLMGIITSYVKPPTVKPCKAMVETMLLSFVGTYNQPYPPYSSGVANGKPLYYWSRKNLLNTVQIPEKEITVEELIYKADATVTSDMIVRNAVERIQNVQGDFRQEEIIEGWRSFLKEHPAEKFPLIRLSVKASSGTYVRSIIHEIGKKLGCGAVTYSIVRSKIGSHTAVM